MKNVYEITNAFEEKVAEYTGAPYCVALDNMSNALFLALTYIGVKGIEISIPSRTYPSVPCEIIRAGAKVKFYEIWGETIKGAYQLKPTLVWDSALRFTADMYMPGTFMCLSFTGPYKHLKLSKGGAILTDDERAMRWFRRARYSGRRECSYFEDDFDMLGWNMYMIPELATRGLLMMANYYERDGRKKHNPDLELPYPDLSQYKIYQV